MRKKEKTLHIIRVLKDTYPDAHCELDFENPLELLIATILSAQCTDARVNMVTKKLFQRFRSAKEYAESTQEEMEELVHSTGFYRNKAKNIRAMAQELVDKYGGEVPRSMEELNALPGVGRKTANVVLGNAFDIHVGVVVDTHVMRLATRFGITKVEGAEKIEKDLMKLVPRQEWTLFSHLLIWHGRRRCTARKPDCGQCEIYAYCARVGVREQRGGGREQ